MTADVPPETHVPDAPGPPAALDYLAIEGAIGAGTTTLARLLAACWTTDLVLEQFEDNPFLERFYQDQERWAFQTQLAFLASRFRQQKELAERDLFHDLVVSDYTFDKDRIFARQTLSGDERQLYESLFRLMEPTVPTPDLVVYLQSSPERLMANIAERDRPYERDMDPDYIARLHAAYNQYFRQYDHTPLLVVNASEIDFVDNPEDFRALARQISTPHASGTRRVHLPET
jgi:deoxyadenosine/deoxycytidine kinase